jgi:hypothetical protein
VFSVKRVVLHLLIDWKEGEEVAQPLLYNILDTYFNFHQDLSASLATLLGDVLVAAGCVAYLGPFTSTYRDELMGLWISHCKKLSVPASENFR